MGKVKIKVVKKEKQFIDGATGDKLTPEQFYARHKTIAPVNLGQSGQNTQG